MECCNVIVMKADVLQENYLVISEDRQKCGEQAEYKFKQLCERLAHKRSLDEEEVDEWMTEGYTQLPGTDYEILLSWPEVQRVEA